jgi:hypothetical protein
MPVNDTGTGVDTGVENEAGADSEAADSGLDSSAAEDAADSATVHDTGTWMDSTVEMDSAVDTGTAVHDTGTTEVDSGADTGSEMEAGRDSAADTGTGADASEGGATLVPCTTAGQTNCVQCDGWSMGTGANGGLCTPAEAILVQHDIDKGYATAAGPESTTGPVFPCYECLLAGGCLDDSAFGDKGKECGDPLSGGTEAACLTTLTCLVGSGCASTGVSTCFCGTAGVATACQGDPAPGPINGKCATQIAAGLGFPVSDGTDNTKQLTNTTLASGMADQILQCAISNSCTACTM